MKIPADTPIIMDGATATALQAIGMPVGGSTVKWILENPEALKKIQRDYVGAGSAAVLSPTFGANRHLLGRHNVAVPVREINRTLVSITRDAVGDSVLVGGDIAPTGMRTPPLGETGFEELVDIYVEQSEALAEAGVDFFFIETQMNLSEARAAVLAARSHSSLPILVSFACSDNGRTIYGGNLISALVTLQDMGITAFGINCCGDLPLLGRLLTGMDTYSRLPLIVKPNAGHPDTSSGEIVYKMTPEELASHIGTFVRAGVHYFGGCCGTAVEHIRAVSNALEGQALPKKSSRIKEVYASEYRIAGLSSDMEVVDIELKDDFLDGVTAAEENGAELLYMRIRDEDELRRLQENQQFISLPLCIECSDGELTSRLLRVYNGKPVLV